VKAFFKHPLIGMLSSVKLSAFLLVIVAFASARGTFIENDVGRDGAYDLIYATRWFELVLGMLAVSLMLLFAKRWPYQKRQVGFVLVHLSMVVILVGAWMTRNLGYEGTMPIREGEAVNYIYSAKSHAQVVRDDQIATYPLRMWRSGANNIWQNVSFEGEEFELGVTEYWPYFTEVYREGPGGPAGFSYRIAGHDHEEGHMMVQGERGDIGTIKTHFRDQSFSDTMSVSRYGDLRLNIDGDSCTVPVTPGAFETVTCGEYQFEITAFHPNFRVEEVTGPDGPLVNPMIKVAVTTPAGVTGERILFAFHPDFSMGHDGGDDPFADLNMMYQVNRGLEFAPGGETGVVARASFEIKAMDVNAQEETSFAAGEVFPLREAVVYRDTSGDVSFVPSQIMASVILAPSHSDNTNNRSAARLVLRDKNDNAVEAICMEHDRPQDVELNGRKYQLSFGPVVRYLPYSVRLDDFVLATYPGSDNPATYESYVSLFDDEMDYDGIEHHIYMNYPMNHRGSKHFQSSYDQDRLGTVLSVNHDPGKWPTYAGYIMISLGFLLIILKDALFPIKKKQTAAVLAAMLACGFVGSASAQSDTSSDEHIHDATEVGFVEFSPEARDLATRLIIQDYQGRMKPLDTMAREMVMKVTKRSEFEGHHPVDLYLSWSLNPIYWWDKPIISIKRSPGMKDLLGVTAETTHVSAASLFGEDGQYSLSDKVRVAHRTPDRERSKTQRDLIRFDESFNLLYICFREQTLAIYPIPDDENNTWGYFEELSGLLTSERVAEFEAAHGALSSGVKNGNNAVIVTGLTRATALQKIYGAAVVPGERVIDAELFYNKSHLWRWMTIPLMLSFVILMGVYLWQLFRNQGGRLSFKNPFYSLGVFLNVVAFGGMILAYTLRWIASERIPISNGHESLLFISLAVALSGLIFELKYRLAVAASLGALLTTVVIGVSMFSTFDPAIGPLVPVLVSYWLNIHVTIITSSYGFLGLSALVGALTLLLLLGKGEGKNNVRNAVKELDLVNKNILITGLGLLTIGTLLGGVWANESWGRYWGWDPKETWAFISILVYAVVLHFRWIPAMRSVWLNAALSLAAISSIIMTYFGVNYFLSGLHSYAAGEAAKVPDWAFVAGGIVLLLIVVSGVVTKMKSWGPRSS
jgi:cytochrome c-type biogenesis protein CcsB